MTKQSEVAGVSELLNQKNYFFFFLVCSDGWFQGESSHTKGREERAVKPAQWFWFWLCLSCGQETRSALCLSVWYSWKGNRLRFSGSGESSQSPGWRCRGREAREEVGWWCGFKDLCSDFLNSAQRWGHSWSNPSGEKEQRGHPESQLSLCPPHLHFRLLFLTLPQGAALEAILLRQSLTAKWWSLIAFGKLWSWKVWGWRKAVLTSFPPTSLFWPPPGRFLP